MSGLPAKLRITLVGVDASCPSKRWIIPGFLGERDLTIVYGEPGSGKSALMLDAAAHVASGTSWFGREVAQCAVLYLAAERADVTRRRAAAWCKAHGIDRASLGIVQGAFDLVGVPGQTVELLNLARDAGLSNVGWIIVDTKARTIGTADPNSDREMNAFLASLVALQRHCAVTVIDHVPLGSPERVKGAGVLPAAADATFRARRLRGGYYTLTVGAKPPNDGPDDLAIAFTLSSIALADDGTNAPVVVPARLSEGTKRGERRRPRSAEQVVRAFDHLIGKERGQDVGFARDAVDLETLREKVFESTKGTEPTEGPDRTRWRNSRNVNFRNGLRWLVGGGYFLEKAGYVWRPAPVRGDAP